MPEVALHDVDRDAGIEQAGGPGVPEPVGPLEVDQPAGAVADAEPPGQLGQLPVQGRRHIRPVGVAVEQQAQEQVAGTRARRGMLLQPAGSPLLLLPDDRDDLGVDQDGVRGAIDLRLLVAEPGNHRARLAGRRASGQRQQRVSVEHEDLADPAAEAGLQHHDPHCLRVIQAAVTAARSELADPGHDLPHRGVVDDIQARVAPAAAGKLPGPVKAGVPGSQFPPSRLASGRRGRVLVVVHEQVELLDMDQHRLGVRRRYPLPRGGAAAGLAGPHLAEEVLHQLTHPGRVGVQPRLADSAPGQEPIQHGEREYPLAEGRPAQHPGFQRDLAVPLRGAAQPLGSDAVEVDGLTSQRLVLADRDAGVFDRVPGFPLPPRAGVVSQVQQPQEPQQDLPHLRDR